MSEFKPIPTDAFDLPFEGARFAGGLYRGYSAELVDVRRYMLNYCYEMDQRSGQRMQRQFNDLEAELMYMLIRETNPETVVEISPFDGWSSMWALLAIEKNRAERGNEEGGHLFSYDLRDTSTQFIPERLREQRTLVEGDVVKNEPEIPGEIDFLLMDSAHSAPFARWYFETIIPRVVEGGVIIIHDICQPLVRILPETEARFVRDTFKDKGIRYLSLSSINAVTAILGGQSRASIEDREAFITRSHVAAVREEAMIQASDVPPNAEIGAKDKSLRHIGRRMLAYLSPDVGVDLRPQSSISLLRPNNASVIFVMSEKLRPSSSSETTET